MSVHVTSWVLRHSEAHLADRLVLLVLADKADADGTNAWPSVATIAQESRLTERQVQRSLRKLEESGAIVREGRHRKAGQNHGTYVYAVIMKGDNLSPLTESKGDIHSIPRVSQMSPEPSLEQPSELLAAAPQNGVAEKIANSIDLPHIGRRPKPTRAQRDEVWDTLTDIFGPALTRSAETLRGKHVASLAEAGATRDEIMRRAKAWPSHFDTATLTAAALEKHWDTLGRKPLRRRS